MKPLNFSKEFFSLTDSTTYIGQDLLDFYSNALLTFPTAKEMLVVPNVKSIIKLPNYNLGSIIQADSATWNATGEGTLSEKTFTVTPVKVNLEFAVALFEQNFLNEYMKAGSTNGQVMPDVFSNYIAGQVMKQLANDLEVITWAGIGSGSTYPIEFSRGLVAKLNTDAASIKVTATTVTSANVIAEMTKVYNAQNPAVLLNYTDVKLYVSSSIARAYKIAQHSQASGMGYNWSGEVKLNFLGYDVIECPGLGTNQMCFASKENLVLLTDLSGDFDKESSISVIDMYKTLGTPTVRIALRFKFSADYKKGSEIVIYS